MWTIFGHYYRYSVSDQIAEWNDGVSQYIFERSALDSFDPVLYREVRSIARSVYYIKKSYVIESDEQALMAVFDFTYKRFMHFMYPHHTWVTSPFIAMAEAIFPDKSYNQMALADDKLRHSAVASCDHAANVFTEIFRAMGGEAQVVSFDGHVIAEARIGSRFFFVDPNLERLIEGKVRDVVKSESMIRILYAGYPDGKLNDIVKLFQTSPTYFGYNNIPFPSQRIYRMQIIVLYAKWIVPIGFFVCGTCLVVINGKRY